MNNNICINCGKPATCRHHVVPKSLGGNDTTNVVPLCDICHSLIHKVSFEKGQLSHSELTKIGLQKAKKNGKQIGRSAGTTVITKKSIKAKEDIIKYNADFEGTLNDKDTMKLIGIARNTFYKYKKELKEKINE